MTQIKQAISSLIGSDPASQGNTNDSMDQNLGSTRSGTNAKKDAMNTSQKTQRGATKEDTTTLGEVNNTTKQSHSIEEVERKRNVDRHENNVQVIHQPINSEEHSAEQVHQKTVPTKELKESHKSNDKDAALLDSVANPKGLNQKTKSMPNDSQVIDKGEKVNETVHSHTQNVIVPVINHDVHEHHRIKTTAPTHQVIEEAPVIHQAKTMPAVSKDDYVNKGGVLGSNKTIAEGNFLASGN
jgi:hypothetical protein